MLFTMIFPIAIAVCIVLTSLAYVLHERKERFAQERVMEDDRMKSLLKASWLIALPHLLILSFLVFQW